MKCPFCASQVDDDAVVCKFCRRDISIQKPLIETNRLLEIKVESLETELARLKVQLATHDLSSESLTRVERASSFLAIYLLLPIATLVAIFVVLVIVLDGHYIWLRFATVIAAAVFGYVLEYRRRPRWLVKLWFAAIVGAVSVMIMATIQFFAQGVPILSDFLDNLDMTGYMISISLGLILGSLIALAIRSLHLPHGDRATGFAGLLAVFLAHNLFRGKGIHLEARIERWTMFIRLAAAAVTAAAVIYSGFSKFTR